MTSGSGNIDISGLPRFAFGNTPRLADRLAALVVAGRKTATAWPVEEGLKGVEKGLLEVVDSGDGTPVALIETIQDVEKVSFDTFTQIQAEAYGEGDLSLAYWKWAHEGYYRAQHVYQPDMQLYLQTFRLKATLDDDFQQDAPLHVKAEIDEAAADGFNATKSELQ